MDTQINKGRGDAWENEYDHRSPQVIEDKSGSHQRNEQYIGWAKYSAMIFHAGRTELCLWKLELH